MPVIFPPVPNKLVDDVNVGCFAFNNVFKIVVVVYDPKAVFLNAIVSYVDKSKLIVFVVRVNGALNVKIFSLVNNDVFNCVVL